MFRNLKRVGRNLVEAEGVVLCFNETEEELFDHERENSVAMTARMSCTSTQRSVATSVAEVEYHAALKGTARRSTGMRSVSKGFWATNSMSYSEQLDGCKVRRCEKMVEQPYSSLGERTAGSCQHEADAEVGIPKELGGKGEWR